jgi:hypothetical protein
MTISEQLAQIMDSLASLRDELSEEPFKTYNVRLCDLGSPAFRLRCPLLAVVETYSDEVVARLPEFDLYAGASSDAVELSKLKAETISLYQRLQELGPDQLGPLAIEWLATFKAVLEPGNA